MRARAEGPAGCSQWGTVACAFVGTDTAAGRGGRADGFSWIPRRPPHHHPGPGISTQAPGPALMPVLCLEDRAHRLPWRPAVEALRFSAGDTGPTLHWETKIPHAVRCSQKKRPCSLHRVSSSCELSSHWHREAFRAGAGIMHGATSAESEWQESGAGLVDGSPGTRSHLVFFKSSGPKMEVSAPWPSAGMLSAPDLTHMQRCWALRGGPQGPEPESLRAFPSAPQRLFRRKLNWTQPQRKE